MKYLKRFNENSKDDYLLTIQGLRQFCDEYLAYLKDDGYRIVANMHLIEIHKDGGFSYRDVKDYFIPFITFLNDEYELEKGRSKFGYLSPISLITKNNIDIDCSVDQIINNKVRSTKLKSIYIRLLGYS